MSKTLKCEFYSIEKINDSAIDLSETLRVLLNLNSGERNFDEFGVVFRMDPATGTIHRVYGDLVRIRMHDLPEKCDRRGRRSPLTLSADEGLGESNAFMIDSDRKILVIQKNKFGMSANTLRRYIRKKTGDSGNYNFLPILSRNAVNRIRRLQTIRKIEVGMARINPELMVSQNHSFSQAASILNHFEGNRINLVLSMSHAQGSMNKGRLRRAIQELFSSHDHGEIEKFQVDGYDEEDQRDIIDLLADRIFYKNEYDVPNRNAIPYSTRKRFIEDAYGNKASEIREVMGY